MLVDYISSLGHFEGTEKSISYSIHRNSRLVVGGLEDENKIPVWILEVIRLVWLYRLSEVDRRSQGLSTEFCCFQASQSGF